MLNVRACRNQLVFWLILFLAAVKPAFAGPAAIAQQSPPVVDRAALPDRAIDDATAAALVRAQAAWRSATQSRPTPDKGCFKAEYPDATWKAVPCADGPTGPQIVAHGRIRPKAVGNGADYAATITGTASSITGSFTSLAGATSVTAGTDPTGKITSASNFALQLNTNQFSTSACTAKNVASTCRGWVQFLYSNSGGIYIEYSLLNRGSKANCPTGYTPYPASGGGVNNCYFNTNATSVPVQPISNIVNLKLNGSAATGGNDTVKITTSPTQVYAFSYSDSKEGLAKNWNAAEFGIFGDQNSTQTVFNAGSVVAIKVATDTASGAVTPTCSSGSSFNGWTGETSNLNLASDCSAGSGAITYTEGITLPPQIVNAFYQPISQLTTWTGVYIGFNEPAQGSVSATITRTPAWPPGTTPKLSTTGSFASFVDTSITGNTPYQYQVCLTGAYGPACSATNVAVPAIAPRCTAALVCSGVQNTPPTIAYTCNEAVDFYSSNTGTLAGATPLPNDTPNTYSGLDQLINPPTLIFCQHGSTAACGSLSQSLPNTCKGGAPVPTKPLKNCLPCTTSGRQCKPVPGGYQCVGLAQ